MAAQELRWLTYLLTDLGEPPRSPPVLYVDNKAMLALCREQRLEHRTKHIALRYFLARELQQRGQLRLAYVASEANTVDVFTKALAPCDHQRCCTQLATTQPRRRAAPQPSRRVARHPSRPAAEPPDSQAAQQPSRPSRPAAEQPEPPEPPSCPAAVPLLHLPLCPGPTYSDWADGLSLFDLTSGASPAPPDTADSSVRSQWATRDAAARLAVRRHLPTTEHAHVSQYKSAQTLYYAVVARYSSPATAALSRLFLPYLMRRGVFLCGRLRSITQRISLTFSPGSPCQRPPPPCCGRGRLAMRLRFGSGDLVLCDAIICIHATQRSSQGYTFSLGSGSVSWRSTRSSSVLSSNSEAEIYAGAMAAQELRWLTYLLTDLGEQPRSPPVLYVDNKAMLALCREHRLEHRTKHIALRYFLARELQQRGQLRLAYVASEANTADIFTKALPPGDHQHFCTMLGLVPTWLHLLTS
ncbi:unnamed protein product [Closterium sp. NIES-54]